VAPLSTLRDLPSHSCADVKGDFMSARRLTRLAMQALAALAVATSPASAQSNSTKDTIGALGNLFGSMAKAGAKSKALKQWQAQDAQVVQCINTIYSSKNLTADSFVAAGVGPNDPSMAPVINICKVVMTTPPKTNFPCNVTNANGQQVASTCSESYAATRNGSLVAISRDDFLRAAGNSEQVQLANFETVAAQNARLQAESKKLVGVQSKPDKITNKSSSSKSTIEGRKVFALWKNQYFVYAVIEVGPSSPSDELYGVRYANGGYDVIKKNQIRPDNIRRGDIIMVLDRYTGFSQNATVVSRDGDFLDVRFMNGSIEKTDIMHVRIII
jgi:hypothetical protein